MRQGKTRRKDLDRAKDTGRKILAGGLVANKILNLWMSARD